MGMWSSTTAQIGMRPKQHWIDIAIHDDGHDDGQREFSAFVDCIENGVESEMNAEIAAHTVEIICGGYESAASGKIRDLL